MFDDRRAQTGSITAPPKWLTPTVRAHLDTATRGLALIPAPMRRAVVIGIVAVHGAAENEGVDALLHRLDRLELGHG